MKSFLHRFSPLALLAAALAPTARAQQPASQPAPSAAQPAAPPEQTRAKDIDDLVAANRILVDQGVLDAYGHVSIRVPGAPKHFLLARSVAPELVTAAD